MSISINPNEKDISVIKKHRKSFIALGLTDEQELFQRNIIESVEVKTKEFYNKGLSLTARFATILQLIKTSQQNSVIDMNENNINEHEDIENEPIRLF